MKINLTATHKKIIMVALVILAIVAGLVLIYVQYNNLRQLKIEVEEEELTLNRFKALLEQRLEHEKNAPIYQKEIAMLQVMMPDKPEEEELLRYFAYLAEEYDLRVNQIGFGARVIDEEKGFVQMPLAINLEGRYHQLVNLLGHLRHGERAVRIDNLDVSLSGEDSAQLQINISASAFHRIIQ